MVVEHCLAIEAGETEAAKVRLREVAERFIGNSLAISDMCHRKAPKVAASLIEGLVEGKISNIGVSLVHLKGHSAACLTDLDRGVKMAISAGSPMKRLPEDYSYFGEGLSHCVFGNPETPQVESRFLNSREEALAAEAWVLADAKRNTEFYPG
jgi:hypothetical protein